MSAEMSAIRPEPIDEHQQNIVDMLVEWLEDARSGKLRSVAMVGITADGRGMPTAWALASGEIPMLVSHLAILQCDLIRDGRDT